jgi:septal ring factor EnvC (AmiA/AmiB activator)
VPRSIATEFGVGRLGGFLACGSLLCLLVFSAGASAADAGALQAKVEAARAEAASLASDLRVEQGELAAAQGRAAEAATREERLSGLLATGEERAAALSEKVDSSRRRLVVEKGHLRRARQALSQRLVAIYESGSPSTASVVLASSDFEELSTRTEYLKQIEDSDTALAHRVEQVRDEVGHQLKLVAASKARVDAYNARLSAARSRISAVRQSAEASASELRSLSAARTVSLSTMKSNIGGWVSDIQAAKAAAAERATAAEAQTEVDRWLGGPYSIPSYIVMCESGGNYSAVNPSSGAGGATRSYPRPGSSTAARAPRRTAPRPNRTRSRPKSGPTPVPAPGYAAKSHAPVTKYARR